MKHALVLILALCGCTSTQIATARADLHSVAAAALGLITAAKNNPALVQEAADGLNALVVKVDPKDGPAVAGALGHLNAGNLDAAALLVAPIVAASSPAVPDASTAR